MGISPYLRRLRERVGHDLLLLPSVAVVPRDPDGRLLLVRDASAGTWMTIGGLVEPDESPEDAAVREAREEAGVDVELVRLLAACGGPDFRVRYPNGDEAAYVSTVYEARVVSGSVAADGDETSEAAWVAPSQLAALALNDFNRALLTQILPLLEG